jgi:DNA primase
MQPLRHDPAATALLPAVRVPLLCFMGLIMAAIDYRVLRAEVGLEAVLKLLDFVAACRRGDQVRGPCPLHAPQPSGSRSFSAHLTKNAYRCFRCGSAGNQLDLWAAATRQPLHQAAIDLCARLHRDIPWLK